MRLENHAKSQSSSAEKVKGCPCPWIAITCFIIGGMAAIAAILIGPINESKRKLEWEMKLTLEDFVPKTRGGKAKIPLHHGSRWTYMDQQEWDAFTLLGLGYQGREMFERPGVTDLKVFEIGSGTGAALSTLVRTYPNAISEVYGIEPFDTPATICDKYFMQEHNDVLKSPKGVSREIIRGFAGREKMQFLPDNYYNQVMANGVLLLIPDIKTLKEIVQESMRIMVPGGIMSATVLTDNERHPIGAMYGSCTLAISQKKFWEALQKELGYTIISIEYMGLWPGCGFQKSRYAIQLRKNDYQTPNGVTTDLAPAEAVSRPNAFLQVRMYVVICAICAALFLAVGFLAFYRHKKAD